MVKKFKVLLLENMDEKGVKFLEEKADIFYVDKHDDETITSALLGKDAVIKRDRGFITKKKGAEELGVYVVNTPYANVEAVTEHNIALMLAIAKPILKVDKTLREGDWDYGHYLVGEELFGKKAGFVGLGKIGYRTAEICKIGFNMDIYYQDMIRNNKAEEELGARFVSIEELCRVSDFVVMALPLNKETEKYFDREKFDLMKTSAFFINNSRGPIVDEEALIDALEGNKIAGAGIDVFAQEPPAKDNPLFKLDNVVVTPHSAANTKSAMVGMSMVSEDIIRILEGKEPKYPANNPKK